MIIPQIRVLIRPARDRGTKVRWLAGQRLLGSLVGATPKNPPLDAYRGWIAHRAASQALLHQGVLGHLATGVLPFRLDALA